jgi:molybdenum cofactor cytidylyltransferase
VTIRVGAAILAAGRGERLEGGTGKPLARLDGRPLVEWALDAVRATELSPVILVVGHAGRTVARAAPPDVVIVRAHRWRQGMARSLGAALDAFERYDDLDAVCIGLSDQPLVGADAYRRLVAARVQGAVLAVATYDGVRQNPVLLGREVWNDARALTGDVGARALMGKHPTTEVDCTGTGTADDVDTIQDLRRLEQRVLREKVDRDADH